MYYEGRHGQKKFVKGYNEEPYLAMGAKAGFYS